MTVVIRRNDAAHRYEAELDGEPAGVLTFRRSGDVLTLVHTEVDPAFEGRGIGSALARSALDDARDGLHAVVRPTCPFVAGWIGSHPEYQDLVASA